MRISAEWMKGLLLAGISLVLILNLFVWKKFHIDYLLAAPLGILLLFQAIYNYRIIYYLLFISIPGSLHLEFGSTALDTSEPFMLFFLGIFLLNLITGKQFSASKSISPFYLWIFLFLFWIIITTITSDFSGRSVKFLLSKIWYLSAFVFIPDKLIESPKQIKTLFWCFLIPLVGFSIHATLKHAFLYDLSFDGGFKAPYPFFTNHVIYGCILTQFLPFVWNAFSWYPKGSIPYRILQFCFTFLLIGTVLTYGRLAWVCAMALPFIYLTIRYKLLDKLIYIGLVIAFFLVFYLVNNNNYYKFAPDFKETIFHEGDFQDHLNATFEGTDVSGMERFYRWVAAKNMVAAKPFLGFGPNTFNLVYRNYADDAFRTWVSDNEDQSTTHNYFLMTCSEQGFIGLFLFLGLPLFMIIKAFRLYHLSMNPFHKSILMSASLCLIVILLHSLLNELIEVDKVGSMFWFSMLLIHKIGQWESKPAETLQV